MKKVKIMLLSLALFAVIGGALAFKAKFGGINNFCTAPAYYAATLGGFYCAWHKEGEVYFTTEPTSTTSCQSYITDNFTVDVNGVAFPVCTALTQGATTDTDCNTVDCASPVVTVKID